jgi:hypothetical protein
MNHYPAVIPQPAAATASSFAIASELLGVGDEPITASLRMHRRAGPVSGIACPTSAS